MAPLILPPNVSANGALAGGSTLAAAPSANAGGAVNN
jgi:hypothetical protein